MYVNSPTIPVGDDVNSFPIVMVPYTSNPDFVGRETILETLKHRLGPSHASNTLRSQMRAALFGLGGVG